MRASAKFVPPSIEDQEREDARAVGILYGFIGGSIPFIPTAMKLAMNFISNFPSIEIDLPAARTVAIGAAIGGLTTSTAARVHFVFERWSNYSDEQRQLAEDAQRLAQGTDEELAVALALIPEHSDEALPPPGDPELDES